MNSDDRLLAALNVLTGFVLAPLAMLSILLQWAPLLQAGLTLAMVGAAFAPQLGRLRGPRRR